MYSYDLKIGQGETYNLSISLTSGNGVPIDLTNCLISGFLRKTFTSSGILSLNPQVIYPPNSGTLTINIPSTGTQLLPSNIYVYDIFSYNTGYQPILSTKILRGYARVYPDVTY